MSGYRPGPSYSAQQSNVSYTFTLQSCVRRGFVLSQIQMAMFSAVGFSNPGISFRQW